MLINRTDYLSSLVCQQKFLEDCQRKFESDFSYFISFISRVVAWAENNENQVFTLQLGNLYITVESSN